MVWNGPSTFKSLVSVSVRSAVLAESVSLMLRFLIEYEIFCQNLTRKEGVKAADGTD